MRPPPLPILAAAALLLTTPTDGTGQSRPHVSGVSLQRFSETDQRFVALAYRRSDLARDGAGLDFGLGLVPQELRARVALVELDVGLARAQSIGPVALLLKGGTSSFIAMIGENELYPGLKVGVAALVPLERRCGLRLDLDRHFYFPRGGTFRLWSLGIGLAVLPASRLSRRASP
jgi:hypothetical protein